MSPGPCTLQVLCIFQTAFRTGTTSDAFLSFISGSVSLVHLQAIVATLERLEVRVSTIQYSEDGQIPAYAGQQRRWGCRS